VNRATEDIAGNRGHVFIVTYGRSGSTLLQRVLQSIDGYFIRGENNHTLYPLYLAWRRAYEARFEFGKNQHGETNPWYGADAIRPAEFGAKVCQAFLEEIIRPPETARVVGFKEIRFHEAGDDLFEPYLDFIHSNFANSKFVFNMRGWENVSKSSWWATMKPERVRAIIEGCDALYTAYAAKYPERCHMMHYEDHAGNPDAYAGLFEFLGEPFDRAKVADLIETRLEHAIHVTGGPKESGLSIKQV